jgi:CDP-paratose 2-epimerase
MHGKRDKVIVITGGAGFIGCNLADRLAASGERVLILDNLSRAGTEENLAWLLARHAAIEFVHGDVRDRRLVWQAVCRARTVYHLAAQVAVTTSVADPAEDFRINALGTLNVLEAVRSASTAPTLLFTSTNKVYGPLADRPVVLADGRYAFVDGRGVDEGTPLDFHSPYGCSKGAADQYVVDYGRVYGVPTAVLRMSCVYGPRQRSTEDQGWVTHFARSVLAGRAVTLYGDGRQVRDILYVDDLIELMQRAAARAAAQPGRVYNVGGGAGNALSLLEVLDLLELHTGSRSERRSAAWRPGDQRVYVSDTSRAQHELNWRPTVGAGEGIRRLVAWLRKDTTPPQLRADVPLELGVTPAPATEARQTLTA